MLTEVVTLFLLILLNAFFAASEMALITINDNRIRILAEDGVKNALLLQKLLREPSGFLATIQVGITLAGFLASAFAAGSFADDVALLLHSLGVPLSISLLEKISVVIITLVLSYFTLVLGELVPKRIAMQKAEPIALFVARPLTLLAKIAKPFVALLTVSTNGIVRLFGIDPKANDEEVTEEEIRMMVDVGEEKGVILDTEKMMINNIFEFDNTTVSDIMTHRVNIVAIPLESTLKEVLRTVNIEKYSRYPIYKNDIDNIVGILHVKDLLHYLEHQTEDAFHLSKIIREPLFVPVSKVADALFEQLQANKVHMAVVIDDYGGTAGIVTIEDLIEEIVGNIFDEHDEEDLNMIIVDENTFLVSGTLSLHDTERILDMELPTEEYDTVGGFLIGKIGYIPYMQEGAEPIEYKGFRFTVVETDDRRITRVKIERLKQTEAFEEEKD